MTINDKRQLPKHIAIIMDPPFATLLHADDLLFQISRISSCGFSTLLFLENTFLEKMREPVASAGERRFLDIYGD